MVRFLSLAPGHHNNQLFAETDFPEISPDSLSTFGLFVQRIITDKGVKTKFPAGGLGRNEGK
jgi:hypothetical protein